MDIDGFIPLDLDNIFQQLFALCATFGIHTFYTLKVDPLCKDKSLLKSILTSTLSGRTLELDTLFARLKHLANQNIYFSY